MLSVKKKSGFLAILACSFSLVATSAQAKILLNETQTGLELFSNSDVTFPSVSPTISGSSFEFGTGPLGEALLVWDLLPAAPRGELDISIAIDYTPLTEDNDPIFALFDGSNYLGLSRVDNDAGGISIARGSATDTAIVDFTEDATRFTGIGAVDPFSYDLWIADGGAGPASVNNFVEDEDAAAGPFAYEDNFIDTDNALSFVLYRPPGSTGIAEQYQINSIAIAIEEKATTPEPATAVGILAALGLGFAIRKLAA